MVEGAGGLLVEIGAGGVTLRELALDLAAPVLVVVRAGLGTLNHTALTMEALASHNVGAPGWWSARGRVNRTRWRSATAKRFRRWPRCGRCCRRRRCDERSGVRVDERVGVRP